MTTQMTPAGWYPDPEVPGGLRYWDGGAWTPHRTPSAGPTYPSQPSAGGYGPAGPYGAPAGWGKAPWKGADLGLPPYGPGALAEPARRLGGRVIDLLLMLPVFAVLLGSTLLIAGPHFGPWFPVAQQDANGTTPSLPVPGFVWLYLAVFACAVATGLVMIAYETIGVARYGRTLGMGLLALRPVRLDGSPLGWGRALVRALIIWVAGFFGWIGLLDPLWCLWDDRRQCLHDKVAGSVMVNDRGEGSVGTAAPSPD